MNGHWKPNDVFYPCSWCRSWPPPLSWTSKASGYLLGSRSLHPWGTAPPGPAPPWLYQQNKQKSITNHTSQPVSVKKSRTARNYIWNNSQKVIRYFKMLWNPLSFFFALIENYQGKFFEMAAMWFPCLGWRKKASTWHRSDKQEFS